MASSALLPNVVKTAIDEVFMLNFQPESARPSNASVLDRQIFAQLSSDRAAEIVEELKTGGYWGTKSETQNVPAASSQTGNQVTYTHTTYAQGEDIPKELFDDDQHSVVARIIREMAINGRQTRERNGMATFRNAFTAGFVGGDGATLCSATHTLLDGSTQDNADTAALTETSLETAIVALAEQKSQAGVVMGVQPKVLLVPSALYREAVQITESKLEANTADNNMNVYSAKYGIIVKQSPFIGTAGGGNGLNTMWFLLGDMHGLERYEREGINTTLVGWEDSRSDQFLYKARFRESVGWSSHFGIYGSDGSA